MFDFISFFNSFPNVHLLDKLVDVAFGLKKIQLPFVIEDDKVPSTEVITEQIEEFEGVQSADVVSLNKC